MTTDPITKEWEHTRIKRIIEHYGPKFFYGKRILDLGCGSGNIADAFARLGSEITCVDARPENLAHITKSFPHLKTMLVDLDTDFPFREPFDIVLSLDLLCHLKFPDKHLSDICSIGEHIILETEILDREGEHNLPIQELKSLPNLSFTGEGSIVSVDLIQNRLSRFHAKYKRIDDIRLNSGTYKYNWPSGNTGRNSAYRRMWFINRDRFLARKIQAGKNTKISIELANSHNNLIKPAALCLYGNLETKDLENIASIRELGLKYDIFLHTNNKDIRGELYSLLRPVDIIISQPEETNASLLKQDLFSLNQVNLIKTAYEQRYHSVYDSVIYKKLEFPWILEISEPLPYNIKVLDINCFSGNSLISDILALGYEYIDEYCKETEFSNLNEFMIKHCNSFNITMS